MMRVTLRRLVLLLAVVGVMALLPGSALAQPGVLGESWTYDGKVPLSWETYRFRWNDSSPLKLVDVQIHASNPTAYALSSVTVRINNGTPMTNVCLPQTAVTQPTIGCNFGSGVVNNNDMVALSFLTNPIVPLNTGGYVFFGDWAGMTTSHSLTGPTPQSVTVGKPSVSNVDLSGMERGNPFFEFELHAGVNAPEIKAFTIVLPHGLSLLVSAKTLHEHWSGHQWTCTREASREIWCLTKTPVIVVSPHFGPRILSESKALEQRVKDDTIEKLRLRVRITDMGHTRTDVVAIPRIGIH